MKPFFPLRLFLILCLVLVSGLSCNSLEVAAKPLLKSLIAEKQKADENPVVVVETTKGSFKLLVFRNEAPLTSENFLKLVQAGTYEGTAFHRYDPRFCVQGGDPTGTGTGGTGKTIPLEINRALRHNEAGMVGMARNPSDKNSASSQFYIILSPQSGLDDDYAVFARVTEGLETVFALRQGDKMNSVYLEGTRKPAKKEKESKEPKA